MTTDDSMTITTGESREDAIRERMEEHEETREEAEAWLDDPSNALLCETCGWAVRMICPECAKGCGCETQCSGWRHQQGWGGASDDDEEEDECPECGATGLEREYNCVCSD